MLFEKTTNKIIHNYKSTTRKQGLISQCDVSLE